MPEKVELLYNDIKKDYEVGTLDDFKNYLNDPIKREKFYNEIVKPNYDVQTLDEFETVYGLKKKEPTVSASTLPKPSTTSANPSLGGGVSSFSELGVITENAKKSESPSTSKKIDIFQPRFGDIQNKKDAVKATEEQEAEVKRIDDATPIPAMEGVNTDFNRAARQTKITRDFYNPVKNPEINNLTKKEQEIALSQKLISEGVYSPEEVAMQNATIAEQKKAKELQIQELKKEKPITLEEYDNQISELLDTRGKTVKEAGDARYKTEEVKQLEFFNKPQNISTNLLVLDNEKQYIDEVNDYLYYLKENSPIEYLNIARKTLGNRGNASTDEHKINQDDLTIQQEKRRLIKEALNYKRGTYNEDFSALVNRTGLNNVSKYVSFSKTLQDPTATEEQKTNITNFINKEFSPAQLSDLQRIEELAKTDTEVRSKLDYADSKNIGPKAYSEEGKQLFTNWWAKQNPFEASVRDVPKAIIGNLVNSAGALVQVSKIFDDDNKYGTLDAISDQVESIKKDIKPMTAERTMFGEDGFDWTAVAPAIANGITTMATLAYGGGLVGGAGKALGVASGTAYGIGTVASSFILTHNDYYQQAIETNALTPQQANAFAIGASMLQSALELVSPGEKIWGESGVAKITIQEAMKRFAAGESFKSILKPLGKEVMSENLQEVMQLIGDKLTNGVTNAIVGKDALETGIKASELAETVGVTTLVTLLAGGLKGVQTKGDSRNEIIDKLATNDKVLEISLNAIQANVDSGVITKEKGEEIKKTLIDRNTTLNEMPKEWNESKKSYLAPAIEKLKESENKKYGVSETGEIIEIEPSAAEKAILIESKAKVDRLKGLTNDFFDTLALTEKQKAEELAKGNPAVVTSVLETPDLSPEQKAQEIINLENEAKKPIETTIGEVIDVPVMKDGKKGSIYQDGQTLVFKYSEGNREIELGNVDEVKEKGLSEFGLKQEERVVSFNDNNQITVDEVPFVNNFSKPLQAINYDDNGNIISVNLNTEDGKNRTFKGQIAEDIAYQLHLQEISKDNVTTEEFINHINTDENAQQEIINGGLQEATQENTVEVNATIQPTESGTGEVETTTEIKRVEKLYNSLSQEDKEYIDILRKKKNEDSSSNWDSERIDREIKRKASNNQEGNTLLDIFKAEDILSNSNSTLAEKVTARAYLQGEIIPINHASISDTQKTIDNELSKVGKGEGMAHWNDTTRKLKKIYDEENITNSQEPLTTNSNGEKENDKKGKQEANVLETPENQEVGAEGEMAAPALLIDGKRNTDKNIEEIVNELQESKKDVSKENIIASIDRDIDELRDALSNPNITPKEEQELNGVLNSLNKLRKKVQGGNEYKIGSAPKVEAKKPKAEKPVEKEPEAKKETPDEKDNVELEAKKSEILSDVTNLRNAKTVEELQRAILKATQETDLNRAINEAGKIVGMPIGAFKLNDIALKLADAIEKIVKPQIDKLEQSLKEQPKSPIEPKKEEPKAEAKAGSVRKLDFEGRPFDKKPINTGDQFETPSGALTTPYPKYSTKRTTKTDTNLASDWLIENAIAEAIRQGNDFAANMFKNTTKLKDGSLTTADHDAMLDFIGHNPSTEENKKVIEDAKPIVITNVSDFKKAIKKAIPSLDKKQIELLAIQAEALQKFVVKEFGLSEESAWKATQGEIVSRFEDLGEGANYKMLVNGEVKTVKNLPDVTNGFYSPLEKIILESKVDKLPAKQWLDKFGKGEEAKWTGLNEWLSNQTGSISKSEIQQFLKDNRIQVVEVVKTDALNESMFRAEMTASGNYRGDFGDTKYHQYQLEGQRENYREILVTLPSKEVTYSAHKFDKNNDSGLGAKEGDWIIKNNRGEDVSYVESDYATNEGEAMQEFKSNQLPYEKESDNMLGKEVKFKSSHFDEPNILTHLRMSDRVDSEGNKVLHISEIQSDFSASYRKSTEELNSYIDKNIDEVINSYKKTGKLKVEC